MITENEKELIEIFKKELKEKFDNLKKDLEDLPDSEKISMELKKVRKGETLEIRSLLLPDVYTDPYSLIKLIEDASHDTLECVDNDTDLVKLLVDISYDDLTVEKREDGELEIRWPFRCCCVLKTKVNTTLLWVQRVQHLKGAAC